MTLFVGGGDPTMCTTSGAQVSASQNRLSTLLTSNLHIMLNCCCCTSLLANHTSVVSQTSETLYCPGACIVFFLQSWWFFLALPHTNSLYVHFWTSVWNFYAVLRYCSCPTPPKHWNISLGKLVKKNDSGLVKWCQIPCLAVVQLTPFTTYINYFGVCVVKFWIVIVG